MTAFSRLFLALAFVSAVVIPLPTALAGDCIKVDTASFAEGLHIIANVNSKILLGFEAPSPGDGTRLLLIIAPNLCAGGGLGSTELSGVSPEDLVEDGLDAADEAAPKVIPLP